MRTRELLAEIPLLLYGQLGSSATKFATPSYNSGKQSVLVYGTNPRPLLLHEATYNAMTHESRRKCQML
jgi:hypothetical protein